VSSYGGLGGAELALASFIEHRPPGSELSALLVSGGPLRAELERLGVDVTEAAGFGGRPGPAALARFYPVASDAIAAARPDVVWAIGQKAALLAAPAARRHRVPIVWHKVDFSWDRQLGVPLAGMVNGVIAVSDAVARALGPLHSRRLLGTVGPPIGLPEDFRAEPERAAPVVGTLARLVPYKGHHHIIRAAALVAEDFPALRVVLAGEPAPQYPGYPDELRALATELGLGERVEMPGFVRPEDVLRRLSVFVNATYRDAEGFGLEGLSGAMLEAGWAGIPVVATRGGGTEEGLIPGQTGTLVERAEPGLLAAAIGAYLGDPELADAVGRAAMAFTRERFAPAVGSARLFGLLGQAAYGSDRAQMGI
jgi:glycosyltransferase involved in cell wall biosynthesis